MIADMKNEHDSEPIDLIERARAILAKKEPNDISGLEMMRRLRLKPHSELWDRLKNGGNLKPKTVVRLAELLGAEAFVALLRQFGKVGK